MNVRRARTSSASVAHGPAGFRALAIVGAAGLTLSYLLVLARIVDVAGGSIGVELLALAVLGSAAAGAVAARTLRPRWAVALGALLLAVGLLAYLRSVPGLPLDPGKQAADTAALLSGMSVLRMTNAGVWALGFAPAPVLVSAYFVLRRAYAPGVLVGGGALAFFVLTGDLGAVPALVGVLGGVAAVGFGRLEQEGSDPDMRNSLLVVLVAMLVLTTSASVVPGGEARPLVSGEGSTTIEASLTGTDARTDVQGSITLSPEVRFTVEADSPEYWRVGAYDRYTGDGWVRTGDSRPYSTALAPPPTTDTVRLSQSIRAESSVGVTPAAWRPARFSSDDVDVRVTELGGLRPAGTLAAGDTYTVDSVVPRPPPERLREAGTDYPAAVEDRYLGLPESTPDRLGRFTANLTEDDRTAFDTAVTVERWLEGNKAYSLDVSRPDGDVASAFVFEMDAGYCTYYATAMVAMLRSQGVPARFVVGYLPGQNVGEDQWVVRGYDSHAWVEVYFPDVGWIRFDPTPADPRRDRELDRLGAARADEEADVDTDRSRDVPVPSDGSGTFDRMPTYGFVDSNGSLGPADDEGTPSGGNGSSSSAAGGGGGEDGPTGPEPGTLLYGVVLLLGAVAAGARLGLPQRLYRAVWLRRLPHGPPAERIEGAAARAEYLLGRRYRPRRPGETRRSYVAALRRSGASERAARLFDLFERARYAGEATERDAEVAARTLADLRAEIERVGGR